MYELGLKGAGPGRELDVAPNVQHARPRIISLSSCSSVWPFLAVKKPAICLLCDADQRSKCHARNRV